MKKTLLILLGVIILLVVVGIWVYLLVFGTPKNSGEVFSNFGFAGSNEQILIDNPTFVDTAPVTPEGVPQALKQLTSRPVAGATFIDGGVRYMERGTGYIYDIMFSTGIETQVSGTTIPRTTDALFSTDGNRALVTYESDGVVQIVAGTLSVGAEGKGSFLTKNLPLGASNIAFADTNRILYLESTTQGSSGVRYDLVAGTSSILFAVPLRDVRVLWGKDTHVYTAPSVSQIGYIYKVGKNLEYVTSGRFGLLGIPYIGGLVISSVNDGQFESTVLNGSSTSPLLVSLLPEKCVKNPKFFDALFCAAPGEILSGEYPDLWYKGVSSLQDILWVINTADNSMTMLSNFLVESGREIDVSSIGTNGDGTQIYFINKNDGTLWMFDLTI